jgi:2TM domain
LSLAGHEFDQKEFAMVLARTDREKHLAAKAHVAALKGFLIHSSIFGAVMIVLFIVDYRDGGAWWVQWPFIGWGLGILGHALLVFYPLSLSTSSWEERKIQETIEKM